MCKVPSVVSALTNPIGYAIKKNTPSNDLTSLAFPDQAAQQRIRNGDAPLTSIGDPGAFFTKTTKQKQDAAFAAGAPQRAADAALNDANVSLAALRARRRAGSALATGASGGDGSLSSVLAYGKSTFG